MTNTPVTVIVPGFVIGPTSTTFSLVCVPSIVLTRFGINSLGADPPPIYWIHFTIAVIVPPTN